MKKIIYSLVSIIALIATFNSCVKDTDYETPQIACDFQEANLEGSAITIESMLGQWFTQNDEDENGIIDFYESESPYEYEFDNTNYFSGYVVSNDRTGNFYHELYLVDTPSDPSFSIKLAIDVADLYTKYDIGRKVYVYLKGLAVNRIKGEMVLGEIINNRFDDIRTNRANENIFRNCEATTVTPVNISLPSEVTSDHIGMLVKFDNMQFDLDLVGLPFVSANDSYDSHKLMSSCENGSQIYVETSTFANFKDDILPELAGSVQGILTRDYDDAFYVLRVSSPDDFSFENERCDPFFFDGFDDNFEKWTTYSVTGDQVWVIDPDYGNPGNCAKMSGYNGSNNENEDWLITEVLDFTGITAAILNFQSARNYSGYNLVVLMSTDYDGASDPNTATWTTLPAILSPSGFVWTDSGDVDISAAAGESSVFIAYKYTCSSSASATYEIDNVLITVE